ncbi:MAG: D-alanyl-D-alanine carboxypeptidase/D-alanyl-D-alanine-endopeptidase [Ignavibacteria bacterium]|nr:D-alanyl-D-alanine carboxypeptidase/D-alanyl-D-alanine-endopeptidase [Ignavibacteria bacterium]
MINNFTFNKFSTRARTTVLRSCMLITGYAVLLAFITVLHTTTAVAQTGVTGARETKPVNVDSVKRVSRISAIKELRDDINALASAPEWSSANLGVSVISVETSEQIFASDPDKYFTPASVQKLFTTAAALCLLGPQYRFATSIYLDGDILPGGKFDGNIIIRGGADPSNSAAFGVNPEEYAEQFASVLDSLGIQSIRGTIIGDDDFLDDLEYGSGWAWDDLSYAYAAQVGGLNIADNSVSVKVVTPLTVNDIATVRIAPPTDYVRVVSALRTVDSTGVTDVRPTRELRSHIVDLVGTVVAKPVADTVTVNVSVENPTIFFLNLVRDALVKRGIRFRGALIDVDDWHEQIVYDSVVRVATFTSQPLSQIISTVNHTSHNLAAECILKTIGKESGGEGSFAKGAEVVRAWMQNIGIAGNTVNLVDGSGLSRFNLTTPRQVCMLLNYMYHHELKNTFIASLAAPGENGTLKRRMMGTRAEKSVHAKTGSMNNVSTLAGYVTTKDGEQLAFAILMNNVVVPMAMAHNFQDLICMRLASFARK